MRAVADGALTPLEAVDDYHEALRKRGIMAIRDAPMDSEITEVVLKHV